MRKFFCVTVACIAVFIAVVTPARAADAKPIDVSSTARVISMPSPAGPGPDFTHNGLEATGITVGFLTPGVPCGDCVAGAGQPNIGLPWPVFTVLQGSTITITVLFESTVYSGPCGAGFQAKQGATTLLTGFFRFPGGCAPNSLYGVIFTAPVPTSPGFTTVTGEVGGGTNRSAAITFMGIR